MNLFELANSYDCVYKWFTYLKETKDVGVVSFVIMPNHVHVILHLPDPSLNLNKIIGNGKRFMAYALIEKLESKKRYDLLDDYTETLPGVNGRRDKSTGYLKNLSMPSQYTRIIFLNRRWITFITIP